MRRRRSGGRRLHQIKGTGVETNELVTGMCEEGHILK